MKNSTIVLAVTGMLLWAANSADAGLFGLDRNSSDVVVSQGGIEYDGTDISAVWDVTAPFQISLMGEESAPPNDIWSFNHYNPGGQWDWSSNNFADYPYYHLALNSAGTVPASFWFQGETGEYLDWALYYTENGNVQTVLGGTIDNWAFDAYTDSADFSAFLRVSPRSTYRTFDGNGEGFINTVEIWGGAGMLTDLVGYQISASGTWGSPWTSTDNITLQAQHIPEPSSLIVWSLLGGLAISVGWWRRRRRGS